VAKFLKVDFLAAFVALIWALVALYVAEVASLCSPQIAFGFALTAAARGVALVRAELDTAQED
jgi:hypothetical protein